MEYFNTNTFYLGMLMSASLFLSNIIFSLFCIYYKIKIIEFSMFFKPWFSLHNEKVMGTKFSLGWLPFGGFIKPLGMATDEEEKNKISQSDLPFAFFNKPKYLRTMVDLFPWVFYIFSFILVFILFANFTNLIGEFKNLINFLKEAITIMFTDSSMARKEFVTTTKEIMDGKNVVFFAFAMLSLIMLILTPHTLILYWFVSDKKKNIVQKALGVVALILIFWFTFWKIPKFVFSFFSISQNFIYISSFFLGMFSAGLVFYFSTLFVVKNISQTINNNKE